jgi:hypothetical protein
MIAISKVSPIKSRGRFLRRLQDLPRQFAKSVSGHKDSGKTAVPKFREPGHADDQK